MDYRFLYRVAILSSLVANHWSDGIAGAVGMVNEHNKKNY